MLKDVKLNLGPKRIQAGYHRRFLGTFLRHRELGEDAGGEDAEDDDDDHDFDESEAGSAAGDVLHDW